MRFSPRAGWTGWAAIIVITYGSVVYFADTRMKTKDNCFSGFPGFWNMLAVVIFALQPDIWVTLGLVVMLTIAMFTPLKFIHPVRTERWRRVSVPVALIWTFFRGLGGMDEFRQKPAYQYRA